MASSKSGLAGKSLINSVYDTAVTASTLRGWNQDPSPHFSDQVVRPHRAVDIADTPEALRVAEIAMAKVVQPLSLVDDVSHLRPRLWDEADLLVADLPPLAIGELSFSYVCVTAALEEHNPLPPSRTATGH